MRIFLVVAQVGIVRDGVIVLCHSVVWARISALNHQKCRQESSRYPHGHERMALDRYQQYVEKLAPVQLCQAGTALPLTKEASPFVMETWEGDEGR